MAIFQIFLVTMQAENRAEFAERSVKTLQSQLDNAEGTYTCCNHALYSHRFHDSLCYIVIYGCFVGRYSCMASKLA